MTRDDIATRIRFNLNDAGITFYSANDVNNSIQDGYDEVVAIAQPIELLSVLNWTGELVYYNFSNLISRYLRPIAIFDNRSNRWLENKGLPFLQSQRIDFESVSGPPFWYHVLDFNYTVFNPRYQDTSGTFDVLFKAAANTLIGSDVPSLPNSLVRILELYGTADLLEQNEEYEKAERYWYGSSKLSRQFPDLNPPLLGYFDYLEKLKQEVRDREQPDRYHTLRDHFLRANV